MQVHSLDWMVSVCVGVVHKLLVDFTLQQVADNYTGFFNVSEDKIFKPEGMILIVLVKLLNMLHL